MKDTKSKARTHRELSAPMATKRGIVLSLTALASASGLLLSPHRITGRAPLVRMDECAGAPERIAKLDATLQRLAADGFDEDILAPLKKELSVLKLENVRQELAQLRTELSSPEATPLPSSPLAPLPSSPLAPPPSATVTTECAAIIGLC